MFAFVHISFRSEPVCRSDMGKKDSGFPAPLVDDIARWYGIKMNCDAAVVPCVSLVGYTVASLQESRPANLEGAFLRPIYAI